MGGREDPWLKERLVSFFLAFLVVIKYLFIHLFIHE